VETAPTTTEATGEPEISQSVFRVKANRCASPENSWTTGFAIDTTTIATVAHALESTLAVTVIDVDEVEHEVEVAYVDDQKDIALLRLVDATVEPLPVAEDEAAGDVWLVTFKQKEEQPVVRPASVLDLIQVTMDGQGARDAIKLTADISVGDSGGPVVNSSGEVLGMIFATTIDEKTGWAIAQPEVTDALVTKNANRPEVVPPACTTDPTE
jgi:S1-C subfamily serine protease